MLEIPFLLEASPPITGTPFPQSTAALLTDEWEAIKDELERTDPAVVPKLVDGRVG